jgi:hypothetical protein
MRKKIIILLSSGAVTVVFLIYIVVNASKPPPLRVGETLKHPFLYLSAQVEARQNNAFITSFCGTSGDGSTCVFGTHFFFPPNGRDSALTRSFKYQMDTNGTVVSITSRWKWFLDF